MSIWDNAWTTHGQQAADLLKTHAPLFKKVVAQFGAADFEEMYADAVVYRLPRFMSQHDPTRLNMNTWLCIQVQFYCRKFMAKQKLSRQREIPVEGSVLSVIHDKSHAPPSIKDMTRSMVMTPLEEKLVQHHFIDGVKISELARDSNVADHTLRRTAARLRERLQDHI